MGSSSVQWLVEGWGKGWGVRVTPNPDTDTDLDDTVEVQTLISREVGLRVDGCPIVPGSTRDTSPVVTIQVEFTGNRLFFLGVVLLRVPPSPINTTVRSVWVNPEGRRSSTRGLSVVFRGRDPGSVPSQDEFVSLVFYSELRRFEVRARPTETVSRSPGLP